MKKFWLKDDLLPETAGGENSSSYSKAGDSAEAGSANPSDGYANSDDFRRDDAYYFDEADPEDDDTEGIALNDDNNGSEGSNKRISFPRALEFIDAAALGLITVLILFLIACLIMLPDISDTSGGNNGNSQAVIGASKEETENKSKNENGAINSFDEESKPNVDAGKTGIENTGHGSEISDHMTEGAALSESVPESADDLLSSDMYTGLSRLVFGNDTSRIPGARVTLSGITGPMRQKTGMLEAALIRKLSAFLEDQDVHTNRVEFYDKVIVSGGGSCAYEARIAGYDGLYLTVIFYPEIAGEFIFILSRRTDSAQENTGRDEDTSGQGGSQADPSSQTAGQQTEAAASADNSVQQPIAPAPTQNNEQPTQSSYDATQLTIKSVPQTLLNYIRNRYDFQYSLYDYLYRNGYRSVKKATVSDYEINGDSRTATINLRLDDGSSVTAIYDRDTNSYAFH